MMSENDAAAGIIQLQLRSAEVFAAQGRMDEYRAVLAQVLPAMERPRTVFERLEKFKVLTALSRYDDAIIEAESIQAEELSHRTLEILQFPWNRIMFSRPESSSALEGDRRILREMIRRGRGAPWSHYYLAQLTNKTDPEHAACLTAVSRRPPGRHGWMWREVGMVNLERFDYRGAIKAFHVATDATNPPTWRPRAFSAETLIYLGRRAAALKECLRAVDDAPSAEKGEALAWMGELCLWLGRYGDALTLLDRAISLGGLYGYCWRGAAKLKLGRAREGMEDLDTGLKFLPRDREAYIWRGEARRTLGDYDGALQDLSAEPLAGVSVSRWMWHDFNRALVHAALKNESAMIVDYDAIPRWMTGYLLRRLGLDPVLTPTSAQRVRVLNAGLRLARGYRRPEPYGQATWMGAAGRRPPEESRRR